MKNFIGFFLILLAVKSNAATQQIDVVGLFDGGAVLVIDGKQRLIKEGKVSPEGIKVLEANSKFVRVEIDSKIKKLYLSKKVGTNFKEADPKREVRIHRGRGGHYFTPGRINNRPCDFVIDTGATFIAMNSIHARSLGINYKSGQPVTMSTANGLTRSFKVTLDSVTVGSVRVMGIEAVISDGEFPETILLGNSYLNRVEMGVDAGVMVLQSKL